MYSDDSEALSDEQWISWFTSQSGNHLFCEVEKSYIEDSFNLFGLKQYLSSTGDFNKAMSQILDKIDPNEPETEELNRSAALLYGLIHSRYILTPRGLDCMYHKYMRKDFGECTRMLCKGQAVIPMGCADDPNHGMVKLFCPRCRNVYNCSNQFRHIDGAFFGPTFPNLFFMNFEDVVPDVSFEKFIPRVFGFRIHSSSKSLPKQPEKRTQGSDNNGDDDNCHNKNSSSKQICESTLKEETDTLSTKRKRKE